jgi:alpha-glucosidase
MTNTPKPPQTTASGHRWPEGAIVYQIYPRSFYDSNADGIGDIPGIIQQLPYIKELGVNAIWLSPFYPSPMADFGYDVADYCGVDPIFGKLRDMERLIAGAHKLDIRIMVDLVPNHSSDEHEWFRESRQSAESPYSDWYIWRDPRGHNKHGHPVPPNNWISILTGGSAWEWEPARQQFYYHSFDVRQPDLNWANPKVREAIKDVMRFWLDKGVDGFRVDAVHFMGKDPEFRDEKPNPDFIPGKWGPYSALIHTNNHGWPAMYAYLAEMAAVLREKRYAGRQLFMVTEAYPDTDKHVEEYLAFFEGMDPEVAAPFIFEGLSLPWQAEPWRHFISDLHRTLSDFHEACVASYAFGNHDQYRLVTRLGEPIARSAAVLLLTLPGMAFIYNGDELGMPNGDIPPDLVQDPAAQGGPGRDPERTPMEWTAGPNAGFTTARTPWLPVAKGYQTRNVAVAANEPQSFLSLYRQLGSLRNESEALRYGDIEVLSADQPQVLQFIRRTPHEAYAVLVNFSTKAVAAASHHLQGEVVISSDPESVLTNTILNGKARLRPHEAIVVKLPGVLQ